MQCLDKREVEPDEDAASQDEETESPRSSITQLNISAQSLPRLVFLVVQRVWMNERDQIAIECCKC